MIKIFAILCIILNINIAFAQDNNLNPPNTADGYWNNKKIKSGDITVNIAPFIKNGEAVLEIQISQQKQNTEIEYGVMGWPSYKHYYGYDNVTVFCTQKDGTFNKISHTFDDWIDNQSITFGRTHVFRMSADSECNLDPENKYEVFVNGDLKVTYKLPSASQMDNFVIAAQRNTEISEIQYQKNLQILHGMTQSNGFVPNNNSSNIYSNTPTRTNRTCSFCNGTGTSPLRKSVANYSGTNSYCEICKGYSSPHYHESCPSCMGRGYIK